MDGAPGLSWLGARKTDRTLRDGPHLSDDKTVAKMGHPMLVCKCSGLLSTHRKRRDGWGTPGFCGERGRTDNGKCNCKNNSKNNGWLVEGIHSHPCCDETAPWMGHPGVCVGPEEERATASATEKPDARGKRLCVQRMMWNVRFQRVSVKKCRRMWPMKAIRSPMVCLSISSAGVSKDQ